MKTEIITITDRSGSMNTIRQDVIGGFNSFLAEQKALPGEGRMTFTQFDDHYQVDYQGRDLQSTPQLTSTTFVPRGWTALYDAIGRTLNEQGARIARENWADLVIVCIITDGEENKSREYTLAQIQTMTAHAEANGWKFVYLAANQDAIAAAQRIGLRQAVASNFTADSIGTKSAYATTSLSVTNMRRYAP